MTEAEHKILLVDDDSDLLELLSIRLSASGYEVDCVNSAEAALNRLDVSRKGVPGNVSTHASLMRLKSLLFCA